MGAETRFAYFPAAAVSEGTAVSVQAAADPTITQAGGGSHALFPPPPLSGAPDELTPAPVALPGQFYVMMNPEVLQTASPRTIAPRTHAYTA